MDAVKSASFPLFLLVYFETGSHCVAVAGLKPL